MKEIGPNGYPLCVQGHERTPENSNKNGKCKVCVSAYNKLWLSKNKEKDQARKIKYAEENAEKLKEKRKEKYWSDPEKYRKASLDSAKKNPEKVKARMDRWREENNEHIKKYRSEYLKANADRIRVIKAEHYKKNAERLSVRWAKYYKENSKQLRENRIKYYWNNPELERSKASQYAKEHPMLYRLAVHKRRARIKANGGELSKDIAEKLMVSQKGKCRICKKKLVGAKFHLDHIMPISKGGMNIDSNIQLLCAKCNMSKGAKLPHIYAQHLGMLFL